MIRTPSTSDWPPIIFTSPQDPTERKRIERAAKRGELTALGHGVYLRAGGDAVTTLSNAWPAVVRHVTAGEGRISHRTAFSFNPYADTWYVSAPTKRYRTVSLGPKKVLILPSMPHPEVQEVSFLGRPGQVSTRETALLEVSEDRRGAYARATLTIEELEEFLLASASRVSVKALREIAKRNDRDATDLVEKIGAILSRNPGKIVSKRVRAVLDAKGADPYRTEQFSDLAAFMADFASTHIQGRAWSSDDAKQLDLYAFIASYFSNYIEGTQFPPEDAAGIVYRGEEHGKPPDERTLVATYRTYLRLLNDMTAPPATARYDEFEAYLKRLHISLAGGNESMHPGEFKTRANQAGGTRFVEPGRVIETLHVGWELSHKIESPFHRAVYLGFVVSEVHPFKDGNGRAARLVTDAHLLPHGFSGIVVTTRTRNFYLRVLRVASRRDTTEGDWRALFVTASEKLYARYRDLPVRSDDEALQFCRRENLEDEAGGDLRGVFHGAAAPRARKPGRGSRAGVRAGRK